MISYFFQEMGAACNSICTNNGKSPFSRMLTAKESKCSLPPLEESILMTCFSSSENTLPQTFIQRTGLSNEDIADYYMIKDKKLGEGTTGSVYLAHLKANLTDIYAVKIIDTTDYKEQDYANLAREILLLRQLDHPGIAKLLDGYISDTKVHLVLEYCRGGDLIHRILQENNFTEDIARHITWQILKIVNYMHSQGICHRDIKPGNLLVSKGYNVKMIDFGFSIWFNNKSVFDTTVGTSHYIAPEVLEKEYTYKCDIWSVGVILFLMLSGKLPFAGESEEETLKLIHEANIIYDPIRWNVISKDATELVEKMLTRDYEKRITAAQAMKSEWFESIIKHQRINEDTKQLVHILQMRMSKYSSRNYFWRRLIRLMILYTYPNSPEIKSNTALFTALDNDNEGVLPLAKLFPIFEKSKSNLDQRDFFEITSRLDLHSPLHISYSEFLSISFDVSDCLTKENVRLLFNRINRENKSKLLAVDFENALNLAGIGIKIGVANKVLKDSVNGGVDLTEFNEFMTDKGKRKESLRIKNG